MKPIQEFVQEFKREHDLRRQIHPPNWPKIFADAGYVRVVSGNIKHNWSVMHDWCIKNIGKNHYSWTGHVFWFENEQDAVLFALKWS